jgi:uncharacterized protein YaaQ
MGALMLLLLAIVQNEDAGSLLDSLLAHGYRATRIQTVGGFLQEGNVTVLAVIEDGQLEDVLGLIQTNCHARSRYVSALPSLGEGASAITTNYPIEVQVGGATVFVFDVVRLERI